VTDASIKRCSTCMIAYPAQSEYFYADPRRSDGFRSQCKLCTKTRRGARSEEMPATYANLYSTGHGRGGMARARCNTCGGQLYLEDDTHEATCMLCARTDRSISCLDYGCPRAIARDQSWRLVIGKQKRHRQVQSDQPARKKVRKAEQPTSIHAPRGWSPSFLVAMSK